MLGSSKWNNKNVTDLQAPTRLTLVGGSGCGLTGSLSGFGCCDTTDGALLPRPSPLPPTAVFLDLAVFLVG